MKFKTDQEQLGYIPTLHLSDDLELATKRYREIAAELPVGDLSQAASSSSSLKLPDSAVILARSHIPGFAKDAEKQASFVLLTLKHSMLLACEAGAFIANVSDLQEGRFYSGFIKEVRDFGALVCVGSWRVTGIAHIFSLARRFVEKASDVIQVGQSVRILVSKVDSEKNRFEADLRPSAVSDKEFLKREAEALRLTLLQKDFTQSVPKKRSFVPGSILQAEITKIESYGLVLSVKNAKNLTAVALKENMPEMKPEVGAMHKCAILDYNAETGILDVSLHPELLEKHDEEPEVGTELQVLPALSKKSYCICWSRKPAAVVFAPPYAPSTWKFPVKTVLHSADAAKVILCPFPSKELGDGDILCYIMLPRVAAGCSVTHVGSYWVNKCYIYIYYICHVDPFVCVIFFFRGYAVWFSLFSHSQIFPMSRRETRATRCPRSNDLKKSFNRAVQ